MKRANGQGSIRYDRERKRYELRLTINGQRRKVTGRTQAEATERAEKLRRSMEAGAGLPPEATIDRYLTYWQNDVLPLADLSRSTRDQYARMVNLYVRPTIGRVKLDDLGPVHVRQMLTRLRDQGLSPATLRQSRAVLSRALADAERDGLVIRNAARLVSGVRQDHKEGRTLTPADARTLLTAAQGTEYEALIPVLLSLGLRKGEALGLGWEHLDLDASIPTLKVRRALKKDARGGLYLAEPKTARSRRTVHLPSTLVATLQRHKVRQAETRLAFGPDFGGKWQADGLVFTNSVGAPLDPDRVNREVQALAETAGLGRWTPHELRHSAASLLFAQGVPLKVVSETLGHSSIRVTADVYAHLLDDARTEAADAMESALWG